METRALEITTLLQAWSESGGEAPRELLPLVYDELRALARSHLRHERSDHTLQATALVHEAYLRLVDGQLPAWKNRTHFYGIAARLMRRVLVDHARQQHAAKRGAGERPLALEEARHLPGGAAVELLALDAALEEFARIYPRQARVVELKFFGGLEARESAELMDVSERTVLRDWSFAKLWLSRALKEGKADGD
ncbi:MAG: sigma-70 family RNA polymerase sigma factor [Verrucomicrobia bacterium]|nr:sigma-70 family RNA polymerase sigma factor [Verrucomicrobiota bacterium]